MGNYHLPTTLRAAPKHTATLRNALFCAAALFISLLSGCASSPNGSKQPNAASVVAAEPTYLVIDRSKPFVTTYIRVPKIISPEQLADLKEHVKNTPSSSLENFADFEAAPGAYITAVILRNDYAEIDTVGGLKALLERYDGAAFGVTWNGGLALTENDYMYSSATYVAYRVDKSAVTRKPDRRADPVHPNNHLEPLLGKAY